MAQKVLYNNSGRISEIALSPSSVDLGNVTNDAQLKASDLVTTIDDPGSDTKIPSEQAVREAISASSSSSTGLTLHPFLLFGGGY